MSQLEFYSLLGESLHSSFYFIFEKFCQEYVPPKDGVGILSRLQEKIAKVRKEGFLGAGGKRLKGVDFGFD